MNSRERVKLTLEHKQPDRVPIDMGSTPNSGIAASALARLRKALKLTEKPIKVTEPFTMFGMVEEDVMQALGVDIIGLWGPRTKFGYTNDNWKPWVLNDGTPVLVGGGFTITVDANGDTFVYPGGDTNALPSGKLPKGGFYFDLLSRQDPVDEDNLNGREDFKDQYKLYSEEDLMYYEKTASNLYKNTEYSIVSNFGGGSFGNLGDIPGAHMKKTPGIRQLDEWYMAHLLHPDYIKDVFELQCEVALKNLEMYKQAVGDRIQMILVSGTDFGTQRGEFISPDLFRELYKPFYKKIDDWIHENTSWKTVFHCCGSIVRILDDFVEMGVDVLNPVQCSAEGMDASFLKKKYGDKLVFWGGAVDTQKTLPYGTPEEVRKETLERLNIFSKDGGYIFNPIHNIQAPTPVENMISFFDTVREFNGNGSK